MNREKNILDKLNALYKKRTESKILKVKNKNTLLKEDIKDLEERIHNKKIRLKKLEDDFRESDENYERVKEVFYKRGINFTAINKNYNLKEWDNLLFNKQGELWSIVTKDGSELKILDKESSSLLGEILEDKNYSLVITRIEDKFIKIKLHLV